VRVTEELEESDCNAQRNTMVEQDIVQGSFAWPTYLITPIFAVNLNI
jgi:hypothetical protein